MAGKDNELNENDQTKSDHEEMENVEEAFEAKEPADDVDAEDAARSAEGDIDTKTYEELLEENEALKDRLLRAIADSENMRRRAQREKEDAAKYAISAFARDLLEVSDNLERALESVLPEDIAAGGPHLETLFEGVELTAKGLQAAFDRHKIQLVHPVGERFDPNFHQAVAEIPETQKPHGTVVDVMQTGYLIGDRLLRPAMVTVAKGEPAAGGATGSPGENVDTNA
jgi:molecular chaperone GrpE